MEQILTPKQIQEKYSWSYMTWYRRRSDCLVSPFKDAIIIESNGSAGLKLRDLHNFLIGGQNNNIKNNLDWAKKLER